MPIKIPNDLPAVQTLADENIFAMTEKRAITQDIRPLKILLLNLMPKKIETETQISRILGNTPLQIELTLIRTKSHQSTNTAQEHLLAFYKTFDEVKENKYDGMIITGAPVEMMAFEEVDYWDELCEIMEWTKTHVHSTMHICWGAQAGLYYHYGIQKHIMPEKLFGVFAHQADHKKSMLLRGFDEEFYVPHSRHTTVYREDIEAIGFEVQTGKNAVSILAIPEGIDASAAPDMLTVIAERIKESTGSARLTRDIIFEKALYQASCKAAIKAGREYAPEHIKWIVDKLMQFEDITFCPHGRPVAMELSHKQLDKQFERC